MARLEGRSALSGDGEYHSSIIYIYICNGQPTHHTTQKHHNTTAIALTDT